MELQDFENFLSENDIEFKYSGRSIVMKECPECGSKSWKVHFFKDRLDESKPFWGKCFVGKCEKKYTSYTYLINYGIEKQKVIELHGSDHFLNFKNMLPELAFEKEHLNKKVINDEKEISIANFFKISEWPDHPVANYAKKRKLPEELFDIVYINTDANSIVFVVRNEEGKIVGYQERFIMPINPKMKARTSYGFKVSDYIMEFPNSGNIAVCEGPFTAASAYSLGYHAICTFGSNISKTKLQKIANIAKKLNKKVGIAIENKKEGIIDEANLKAFEKIVNYMFWEKIETFQIYPDDKDLNDAVINGKSIIEKSIFSLGPAIPFIRSLI